MALKFVNLILSTFLLVQYALGKPTPFDVRGTENELDLNSIPGIQLILYVFDKFGSWSDVAVVKALKLMKDVSNEISALESKDEETIARLEAYATCIAKMEDQVQHGDSNDFSDKHDILLEFGSILESATRNVGPSASAKLFEATFKKHGLTELVKDFSNGFAEFSNEFVEETKKLLNSDEELRNRQKIQDFLNEFQACTKNRDKFRTFHKFFELFD